MPLLDFTSEYIFKAENVPKFYFHNLMITKYTAKLQQVMSVSLQILKSSPPKQSLRLFYIVATRFHVRRRVEEFS